MQSIVNAWMSAGLVLYYPAVSDAVPYCTMILLQIPDKHNTTIDAQHMELSMFTRICILIKLNKHIRCTLSQYHNDTIRYDIDLRALKSWRDGQLNLAHGPETKNNEKIKIKNRVAQKKRCRQKSVEAVQEEEVKLRGVGFVKEVGFKPGVKERWSYRCTKWWIRRGSDGWRNRWAGDGETGARMRFMRRCLRDPSFSRFDTIPTRTSRG